MVIQTLKIIIGDGLYMENVMGMNNVSELNEVNGIDQIAKLIDSIKEYQGQTIVINNWVEDESKSNSRSLQTFTGVDILVTGNRIRLEDEDECNIIEFDIDEIEKNIGDTYIDRIDIFVGMSAEISIMFSYMGRRCSILNLI